MQVAISCRHGSASADVQAYITRKCERLLTFFERVTAINVTIEFESEERIRVDLIVDAEHKHNFVASSVGEDIGATFDGVLQKMEQQIRKYKEKLQDHRRDVPMNELVESSPIEEPNPEGT